MQENAETIKVRFISWLLNGGLSFSASTDAIGTEVLFSKNKRKADLIVISNVLYAFEIKSDRDSIKKFYHQLPDYLRSFPEFSVITTKKYLNQIKKITPASTGLILFESGEFQIKRPAKRKIKLSKDDLLMFLSKEDLIHRFKTKNARTISTQALRNRVSRKIPTTQIYLTALAILKKRYRDLFNLFMRDTDGIIVRDDLKGLTGKINRISA